MDAATTSAQRGHRQPTDSTATSSRIEYRLPSAEDLGKSKEAPKETSSEYEDLAPLVLATSHAALILFVTQAVSTMLLANLFGASVSIRFIGNIVPYLALTNLNPADLVPLASYSTAASVGAVCLAALFALVRHRDDRQRLYGLAMGLPMGAGLVAFQFLRHRQSPPFIDGWILVQSSALLALVSVVFLGFKPLKEQSQAQASLTQGRTNS